MLLILGNNLAHLLFLDLPDIVSLVAVWTHLKALGNVNSCLRQVAVAQRLEALFVQLLIVILRDQGSQFDRLLEGKVSRVCVSLELPWGLNL